MREGVQGFARATLAGGCPCLIATKWDVPVYESIQLMIEFYIRMSVDKVWSRLENAFGIAGLNDSMMGLVVKSVVYTGKVSASRPGVSSCGGVFAGRR